MTTQARTRRTVPLSAPAVTALMLVLALAIGGPVFAAPGGGSPGGSSADPSDWPDRGDIVAPSEYRKALKKIEAEDYDAAIALLLKALDKSPKNADVLNMLGFTHRKTGKLDEALGYYRRALDIDPDHKGAREYLGELYLMTGQLAEAQFQLEQLERLCPDGCEERTTLEQAIADYLAAHG